MRVPHRTQYFPFDGGGTGPGAGGGIQEGGGGGGTGTEAPGAEAGSGGCEGAHAAGAAGEATEASPWGIVRPHFVQNREPSGARVPQWRQTGTPGVRYMRYLTVRESVRHRSVALVTRDPALYGELAGFLRERRWPTVSLLPGQRIPDSVAVVLTSALEAPSISHPRVLTVPPEPDRRTLAAAVEQAFDDPDPAGELIVGIDPGPCPGYAILAGARCLGAGTLESPESAAAFASHLRRRFPSRPVRYRVGAGDPPSRNRIVDALLAHRRTVELVNERGTTPHGRRRPRDPDAARSIAHLPGVLVREPLASHFTAGEVTNLQRLSREKSGGRLTISRSSAQRVLLGELTLAEAVDEAGAPALRRGSPAVAEPL